MRRLLGAALGAASLAALCAGSAAASGNGGIAGYVVNSATGRGMPGEQLIYYRWPYVENSTIVRALRTDRRGFFSDITLSPGRYVIAVAGAGLGAGCAIDDVFGGEVSRVRIAVTPNGQTCSGPRVNPTLIDANATADVYRI